jgi:nucleotide-binding universal stress UspA family protein
MFKRVLLCYDGSEVGRRALKRGAELAILVGARVYVLSIIPSGMADAAVVAGAAAMHAWSMRRAAIAHCSMSPLNC